MEIHNIKQEEYTKIQSENDNLKYYAVPLDRDRDISRYWEDIAVLRGKSIGFCSSLFNFLATLSQRLIQTNKLTHPPATAFSLSLRSR
ncbi:hypothetical protein L6164_015825 [Bauhinia variegata]|uniref:Uncharacterized protein n=1 Tax=Bauhinia variegata TaxID=167791 RepID=A0ACB9NLW3_BAUVA|nr:hypothetical protein L6164_015825 [Bauhinia variegata]